MEHKVREKASTVIAECGQVIVDGPGGVALSLTPDAAAETSDRLLRAAAEAQQQILEKKRAAEDRAIRKTR